MARYACSARFTCVVFAIAIPSLGGCEDPDHRADIVVYGDHVPAHTNSGDPFPNPFTAQAASGDPVTTTVMKEIPGLRHPRGTTSWGVEAWATYVFLGNYDHEGGGVFQTIEDQRIGLYDSERKTFCQLDLDPTRSTNAGVEWLSVANPKSRRTRIFYEGIATNGSGGFPFGFVAGDLDNANPCDPATGWVATSRGFHPGDLNAAARAAGQPEACPDPTPDDPSDDSCVFDGMTVLSHDDATNTDTVEIGNWGSNRIIVAQVDGANQLRVLKVDVLPLWQPDDGDPQTPNACYTLYPVSRPAVDRTRPPTDLRFLQAFDKICSPGDSPGCPSKAICPLTNTTCSGDCADAYCTTKFFGSYLREPAAGATCNGRPVSCSNFRFDPDPDQPPVCVDLGTSSRACLVVHPRLACTPNDEHSASTCTCNAPPTPVQEFRFDVSTNTLEATSFLFQSAPADSMNVLAGGYSKTGDVFLSTGVHLANKTWTSRIIHYPRRGDGEHDYRDASATLASRDGKIVPATGRPYPLKTPGDFGFLSLPFAAVEVGSSMYVLNKDTIERDSFGFGQWAHDTQYKVSFGIGAPAAALPQEAFTCAPQTVTACTQTSDCSTGMICNRGWCQPKTVTACESDAGCPSGQVCPALRCASSRKPCASIGDCVGGERCVSGGALGEGSPMNVQLGGAPASLWSSPHSGSALGELPRINAYLTRVPVAVDLPGVHTSQVAPALAWSVNPHCATKRCDRVWLFGAPEGGAAGALQYRTRDQGLWAASWSPLPTSVALAGGPAAVYTASSTEFTDATVEVYARRQTDGKLVRTQLTSALDCSTTGRAACQWAPWQAVPGSPVTDTEPTATIASLGNTAVVFVAVKDLAGQIWLAERRAGTWSAWRAIPGLTSDASPSLVFKLDDSEVWLFARERQSGAIRYVRVDGGRAAPWTTAGGAGPVLPWSTAPTAVYTGRVRLLVGSGTFPAATYQTTFADGAWDGWKTITSGAGTTRRPAAANVAGDLNVVTTYVTNLQEQLVK
jgi:hypothetical protein